MRRTLLLLVMLFVVLSCTVSLGKDVAEKDVVDDWFGMLSARAGYSYNFDAELWQPYTTFPVGAYRKAVFEIGVDFDVDESTEAKGITGVLGGVTFDLGNLQEYGIEVSWARYFEFNIGPFGHYSFDTNEFSGGIMCSVVGLSFDAGNVDRQKKR